MADYTFNQLTDLLKNDSSIQTILDVDALAAPAKTALAGYVASLELPAAQTQHLLWENVGIAVLIQQLSLIYYLPSLGSQTPAPALKRTSTLSDKVIEMQSLESKFPKCQMLIFGKNPGNNDWIWLNTETIQNSGNRVNTLKLAPYIAQSDSFIPGRGTKIGIQFVADPVSKATLPQAGDRLTVCASVAMDVNPMGDAGLKKNNSDGTDQTELAQLKSRLAALETLLQTFGAATATAAGTAGLVPAPAAAQSDHLLRGDRQWQAPDFVSKNKSEEVDGSKTFLKAVNFLKEIVISGAGDLGTFSARTAATLFGTGGGSYLSLSANNAPSGSRLIDLELSYLGNLTLRRINDAYNGVIANIFQVDTLNDFRIFNFTRLGDNVAIKIKKLEGVTPSSEGGLSQIPHGLDPSKILGCNFLVNFTGFQTLGGSYTDVPGYELSWQFNSTSLTVIAKTGNSARVLSKPFTALVFYTK